MHRFFCCASFCFLKIYRFSQAAEISPRNSKKSATANILRKIALCFYFIPCYNTAIYGGRVR